MSTHVVSYVGLAPAIEPSAGTPRLGRIPKQGNALLRYLLGQAGQAAIVRDAHLKRLCYAIVHRRGRSRAKVAVARKLLVRLYIMLRDELDSRTFLDRAPATRRGPRVWLPHHQRREEHTNNALTRDPFS